MMHSAAPTSLANICTTPPDTRCSDHDIYQSQEAVQAGLKDVSDVYGMEESAAQIKRSAFLEDRRDV